jgi:hypothetical protein
MYHADTDYPIETRLRYGCRYWLPVMKKTELGVKNACTGTYAIISHGSTYRGAIAETGGGDPVCRQYLD